MGRLIPTQEIKETNRSPLTGGAEVSKIYSSTDSAQADTKSLNSSSHAVKPSTAKAINVQPLGTEALGTQALGTTAVVRKQKIHPKSIKGPFQTIRTVATWAVVIGFFLLPWINWSGRQAIFFDLPERQFHIFELTFWPQDFFLMALLTIIGAFGLLAITTLAGRLYCGYGCPQTVWTKLFVWIEELVEGQRNQRIKLDRQSWLYKKLFKKSLKHSLWLLVAFFTSFAFVGYFSPVRDLGGGLISLELGFWQWFWMAFFTLATYVNAGWMRELVCIHVCPYARFQSVMFDKDTLLVTYDEARGESRGKRKKNADHSTMGDCLDCKLCVQVCPTGIDIRNGLQYQCIGCAACVDACDSVMEKMNYPKGLVRYSTEHAVKGEGVSFFRPRLLIPFGVFFVLGLLWLFLIINRVPLEFDVTRDRNQLFRTNSEGLIENVYTLKVMNKSQELKTYKVTLTGPDEIVYSGADEFEVNAGETRYLSVRLKADAVEMSASKLPVSFMVSNIVDDFDFITKESRFFGPSWVGK